MRLAAERAPQLAEDALVEPVVLVGERLVEVAQQLLLLLVEALRDDDIDDDAQITVLAAAKLGHPLAAYREDLVWLRPGGDFELHRAVEGRHGHGRSERGTRGRD